MSLPHMTNTFCIGGTRISTSGRHVLDHPHLSNMRTLYLIFSHEHQQQLARLVRTIRLLSPNALTAIHHDPSKEALNPSLFPSAQGLHVIPDAVRGEWGDFSLVEQYLHSFRWCARNLDFDWLVTLTGLTYPIAQLQAFEDQLENSEFDAFVYHFNALDPTHWPRGTGVTRYLFAYFKLPRNPYYYKVPARIRAALGYIRAQFNTHQPVLRIVPMARGAPTRLGIRRVRRPFDNTFVICGGRQMLNLSRPALERLLKYVDSNPRYLAYAKRTLIPDESFFTSIVANDADLKVCNDALRYIKWPKDRQHAASGATITSEELNEVFKSRAPFALKFDSRVDATALDRVDAHLGLSPGVAADVEPS